MGTEREHPPVTPAKENVRPDTYAIHVSDDRIAVCKYRVTIADQGGEWEFVDTFSRTEETKLSLERATMGEPDADGYWLYSRSYECHLDCT
jgi:hypothetical protein